MKFRMLAAAFALALAQNCFAITYGPTYYYLTVTASTGGQVTSANAGIACKATTCSAQFASGNFQLVASALTGYTFTGWSGDCSGTGACNVNMNTDRSVIANFAAAGGTPAPAVIPETGFWFNPAEGGRGYVIEVHSNGNLFIGGFMYDANGNAIWYASGPGAMSGSNYTGVWQQFGNGETLTGAYKPSGVVNPAVGTITVQFLTPTTGTLTLPDGRQISIVRFPF